MINQFSIEFDRNYGARSRTGWSVIINGAVCSELKRYLIIALIKAFYCYWFIWDKEARNDHGR